MSFFLLASKQAQGAYAHMHTQHPPAATATTAPALTSGPPLRSGAQLSHPAPVPPVGVATTGAGTCSSVSWRESCKAAASASASSSAPWSPLVPAAPAGCGTPVAGAAIAETNRTEDSPQQQVHTAYIWQYCALQWSGGYQAIQFRPTSSRTHTHRYVHAEKPTFTHAHTRIRTHAHSTHAYTCASANT